MTSSAIHLSRRRPRLLLGLACIGLSAALGCGRSTPAPTPQSCPGAEYLRVTNETELTFEIRAVKRGSSERSGVVIGTANPGVTELSLINNSSAGYSFAAERADGRTITTFTGENLLSKVHFDVRCMQ